MTILSKTFIAILTILSIESVTSTTMAKTEKQKYDVVPPKRSLR